MVRFEFLSFQIFKFTGVSGSLGIGSAGVAVSVSENNNQSFLPPETFEGYPIGISFRTNSRFTYSLNSSISMIISLNTVDDSRYDNFISFQGELRAYF